MTRMLLLQGRILPLIYWLPYFFCSQSEPRHPSCLQLTPSLVSTIPLTIPSEPRSNCVLVYWFTKILTSHHRSETLIKILCHWLYSLVYIIYNLYYILLYIWFSGSCIYYKLVYEDRTQDPVVSKLFHPSSNIDMVSNGLSCKVYTP